MQTFLQAAAGVIIGLSILILVLLWWLKRKLSRWAGTLGAAITGGMQAAATMPRFRLHLKPYDLNLQTGHAEQLATRIAALRSMGFTDVGRFMHEEGGLVLHGLVHETQHVFAVLYDVFGKGVLLDLASNTEDGRHFVCTNTPDNHLDKPDWNHTTRLPDAAAPELLDRLLVERPTGNLVPARLDNWQQVLESTYNREMDWRVARGGYTDEEIARLRAPMDAMSDNIELSDDMVRQMTQGALASSLENELREAYLQNCGLSAAAWERIEHRLRIVHPLTDAQTLTWMLVQLDQRQGSRDQGPFEELKARVAEALRIDSPMAVFERFYPLQPDGAQVEKLASLTTPAMADVYVMPDDPDDAA